MVDDKGFLKDELSEDGLHPNQKGYEIMAPLAERAISLSSEAQVSEGSVRNLDLGPDCDAAHRKWSHQSWVRKKKLALNKNT